MTATFGRSVTLLVVLNHMTACLPAFAAFTDKTLTEFLPSGARTGLAGNTYSYPAVPYNASQFHYCSGTTAASINNFNDANKFASPLLSPVILLTSAQLAFLRSKWTPDLTPEHSCVRKIMAAFLNELLSLVTAFLTITSAYETQEVILGAGEAVQTVQYVTTGGVMEFPALASAYFPRSPVMRLTFSLSSLSSPPSQFDISLLTRGPQIAAVTLSRVVGLAKKPTRHT
ncbi:hypothetical protein DFH09DRAFT_1339400 [Mycena vulgaris]|nr:hypothetical protein DFH09DRAFT_1339400 [Mycena vulgaris]